MPQERRRVYNVHVTLGDEVLQKYSPPLNSSTFCQLKLYHILMRFCGTDRHNEAQTFEEKDTWFENCTMLCLLISVPQS